MYAYIKVCDDITANINSGYLKPDEKLLTEKEMCTKYAVSISTIRKSMYYLRDKGLIYSKRGSGYYVTRERGSFSKFEHPSLSKLGTDQLIETEVLAFNIKRANLKAAKALKVKVNTIIYEIIRKRTNNQNLSLIEYSLIPVSLCPDLLEDDARISLNKVYFANGYDRVKVLNKLMWFNLEELGVFEIVGDEVRDAKFNIERKLELLDGKIIEYSMILVFESELNFDYIHLY